MGNKQSNQDTQGDAQVPNLIKKPSLDDNDVNLGKKSSLAKFKSKSDDIHDIVTDDKTQKKLREVFIEKKGKLVKTKVNMPVEKKPVRPKVHPDLPLKSKIVKIDSKLKVEKPWLYKNTQTIKEGLTKLGKTSTLESWNVDCQLIKLGNEAYHGMFTAVQLAHSHHYPLQISPCDFWTMIMQGFCQHMELKHEELRDKFVNFEGKKTLSVHQDTFVKGQQNDWPQVFSKFSTQIEEHIGKENHSNLVPEFSTQTPLSKVIHELSLMNAMQHFFSFRCHTDCGISKVRLEGELEDWEKLKEATKKLNEYGLDWWTPTLIEILDKIIATYKEENVDKDFWKHIFKYYYGGGSGVNPSVDGWIVNLIPYIDNKQSAYAKRTLAQTYQEYEDGDKPNPVEEDEESDEFMLDVCTEQPGLDIEKLKKAASGINKTPFVWEYHGEEIEMNFLSGFAGACFTQDGFIKAQMAWGVCEKDPAPKPKARRSTVAVKNKKLLKVDQEAPKKLNEVL